MSYEPTALTADDYAPQPGQAALTPLEQQLARWKQQHREVTAITVHISEAEEATAYIRNPDRNVIAYALNRVMNKQLLEAGEFLLLNCWLGGDERLNPNSPHCFDPAVVAAALQAAQSIEMLAASSKKL